jgi:hypothetical protein
LRNADRARGGLEDGVTWTIDIEATQDGNKQSRAYLVKAKGQNALCEALAPPRNKGEKLLFNDRTIWFVKPGLRKPVSISARQRLTGEAANGDIASTNYARDYEGTVAGTDTIKGEEAFRLELRAKAKSVTYDRIRYWISKKRRLGLKAEFQAVSGDVFKIATFQYGNRLKQGGKDWDFVSEMTITDAANPGNVTVIRFNQPRADNHPDALFNINNVLR